MTHQRLFSIFLTLALLLFSISSAWGIERPFRIGVVIGLSGAVSSFCVPVKNGIELAYSELSKEEQKKFELIYEDDQGMPSKTVTSFHKLGTGAGIDALITCASNTSKAVSPLSEAAKVPHIAIASDYEIVAGKKFVVNLWVTPDSEAPLVLTEAKKRGYKRIARVTTLHDGTLSFKKVFDENNKDNAIQIVLDEEFELSNKDFRSFLTKLRSKKEVDAIFVNLFPGQIGVFARQARELGFSIPLFAFELFEDVNEVQVAQGALENQWYVQADEGTSDFLSRYQQQYVGASTFAAANGYDAFSLLVNASRSDKHDTFSVSTYLRTLKDYQGALGTYSATGDNRFTLPAVVKVVTKDGFKKLY